jgi:hypothetical protein
VELYTWCSSCSTRKAARHTAPTTIAHGPSPKFNQGDCVDVCSSFQSSGPWPLLIHILGFYNFRSKHRGRPGMSQLSNFGTTRVPTQVDLDDVSAGFEVQRLSINHSTNDRHCTTLHLTSSQAQVKAIMDICIPFIYISPNDSRLSRTIPDHIPLHFVQ